MALQGDISGFTGTFDYTMGSSAGNFLTFNGTTAASQNGSQAKFLLSGATSGNRYLTVGATGATTFQMGELSGTGAQIQGGVTGTTLQVGALNTSTSYSGVITGSNIGLTKVGTGALTLSGANTYTGGTNIRNGSIIIGSGDDRLLATGSVVLGDATTSGKLVLGDGTARTQTLAGLTTTGLGGSVVGGAAANSTLTLNIASGTNIFGGKIGGTLTNENNVALTKLGTGTLKLTGANTYRWQHPVRHGRWHLDRRLRLANKRCAGHRQAHHQQRQLRHWHGGTHRRHQYRQQHRLLRTWSSTVAAIIRNVSGDNELSGVLTGSLNGGNYNIHSDSGKLTISTKITSSTTGSRIVNLRGVGAIDVSGVD